ncbi:MAG: mismatch-specific DNA-glycosylase [Dehalococcoidia bacterium]
MNDPRLATTLPHYLRPGLRLVFVGYNPGIESARLGHYYAFRGNVFWRHLNQSGLVPETVGFEDDARLMDVAGIGFTDLCPRPTTRADELTAQEVAEGALRLHRELAEAAPRFAVFSGKGIWGHLGNHVLGFDRTRLAAVAFGEQPERLGETRVWLIPSSSGLASKFHRLRLDLLREIAAALDAD